MTNFDPRDIDLDDLRTQAEAWRVGLAGLSARSPGDVASLRRIEGALAACVATVETLTPRRA